MEGNTLFSFINYLLASLTLLSNIIFALGVIYYFLVKGNTHDKILGFFSRNGLLFGFIISVVSTMGSLFYSEIVGYDPCKLCWFQRIFMYPQTIILGLALIKKDYKIIPYSISLLVVGSLYAFYHNYIYIMRTSSAFCGTTGVSCIKRYVFEFGYITIPVMSISAFVLLISFLLLQNRYNKQK